MAFRIAHVSDLHIAADGVDVEPGVKAAQSFSELVQFLAPQCDLIVVSGDVSSRNGRRLDYEFAAAVRGACAVPMLFAAGNHDDPAVMHEVLPPLYGATQGPTQMDYRVDFQQQPIVVLDSSRSGSVGGSLSKEQVGWARGELVRSPGALLVLHHPPRQLSPSCVLDILLDEESSERLAALLTDAPPAAVLCGHLHTPIATSMSNVPLFVAPSSAYELDLSTTEVGFRLPVVQAWLHSIDSRTVVQLASTLVSPNPFRPTTQTRTARNLSLPSE
jgi:3',5'-cyclic AMP phosphodiesterase CpdA